VEKIGGKREAATGKRGHAPWSAADNGWSAAGRTPFLINSSNFFHFFFSFFLDLWRTSWHFGRMGVQHPHFLKLAPTLGSVKSSFFMEIGNFKKKLIFLLNLEYT
jgi:hypothetical protein